MISVNKATIEDVAIVVDVAILSFIESHGHSAPAEDVSNYIKQKFSEEAIKKELEDEKNNYHIIYYNLEPAGYSNIILNAAHPDIEEKNITKLDRIYLLKKFYGLDLGRELFNLNLALSKLHYQVGMWLYVWKENQRGLKFYMKNGFVPIGSFDFKLSPTHANPNHLMWLKY